MTNLELVQATWRLLGHEDDSIDDIADNSGIKGDVIKAVNDAWQDIQREQSDDWRFRRATEQFQTTKFQQQYVIGTDMLTDTTVFGKWNDSMIVYNDRSLKFVSYDYFMTSTLIDYHKLTYTTGSAAIAVGATVTGDTSTATGTVVENVITSGTVVGGDAAGYLLLNNVVGTFQAAEDVNTAIATIASVEVPATGEPHTFTIHPVSKDLIINQPDQVYSITAHYYLALDSMTTNTSVPTKLPLPFHMLIVYTALSDLGIKFGSREINTFYSEKAAKVMGQLLRTENPAKSIRLRPIA